MWRGFTDQMVEVFNTSRCLSLVFTRLRREESETGPRHVEGRQEEDTPGDKSTMTS